MAPTLTEWAANVDGRYIDRDGYGVPIWQCHDVWLDFLVRVAGGSQGMGYAPSGYTDSVFTHFPVNGVNAVMTKHTNVAEIRAGDVVFWRYGSAYYPYSHVAVAVAAPAGGSILCLTQNPGPTHFENLTLAGALGFLRPINDIGLSKPKPEPEPEPFQGEEEMAKPMIAMKLDGGDMNGLGALLEPDGTVIALDKGQWEFWRDRVGCVPIECKNKGHWEYLMATMDKRRARFTKK